jgi:hypothetical protein
MIFKSKIDDRKILEIVKIEKTCFPKPYSLKKIRSAILKFLATTKIKLVIKWKRKYDLLYCR